MLVKIIKLAGIMAIPLLAAILILLGMSPPHPAHADGPPQGPFVVTASVSSLEFTCKVSDVNCHLDIPVRATNRLNQAVYSTTMYQVSVNDSLSFMGFDGSWTSEQNTSLQVFQPGQSFTTMVKVVKPNSLGIFYAFFYVDAKICNTATTPWDCTFYGASEVTVIVHVIPDDPGIVVGPASISETLIYPGVITRHVTITNNNAGNFNWWAGFVGWAPTYIVASPATGTLAGGASATVTVVISTPWAGGAHHDLVVSEASNWDYPLYTLPITLNFDGDADTGMTLTSHPLAADVDQVVTYTYSITNGGPSTATGVEWTTQPPTGTVWNFPESTGDTCSYDGTFLHCPFADMAVGAVNELTFSFTRHNAGIATVSAFLLGSRNDPFDNNNIASGSTHFLQVVQEAPDLELNIQSPLTATPGSTSILTVSVTNLGAGIATTTTMALTSSTGFDYDSHGKFCTKIETSQVKGPKGIIDPNVYLNCQVGTLGFGEVFSVTLSVHNPFHEGLTIVSAAAATPLNEYKGNNAASKGILLDWPYKVNLPLVAR
jgi:uncharacterized repeat protein (TIGR01451 family)